MRRLTQTLALLTLTATVPQVAQADWQAIVVGQPGPMADLSFADAFHASQAFEKGGIPVIDIIRDLPRARLTDTLAALTDVPRLIIFYSGRIPSGSISMNDGTMPLATILRSAAVAGTQEMILMIENCTSNIPDSAQVILPETPEGMELMVMSSAEFGDTCASGERLSDELKDLSQETALTGPLLDALDDMVVTGSVSTPVMLSAPVLAGSFLDEGVIELLPDDVILLVPIDDDFDEEPEAGDTELLDDTVFIEVVLPARAPTLPQETIDSDEPVITFAALPQAQIAALPLAAGLPEPSVLVGLIEGVTDASLDTGEGESSALDYENLEAARALREANPELFASMLSSGAFDPPEDIVALSLQTELKRMNCYRSRLDNDWGRGSRSSVGRYFQQVGESNPHGQQATVDLFRYIIGRDDVACPTPVAATRSSSSSSTRSSSSNTSRNTSSGSTASSTPSAPAASSGGSSSSSSRPSGNAFGSGSGVFR